VGGVAGPNELFKVMSRHTRGTSTRFEMTNEVGARKERTVAPVAAYGLGKVNRRVEMLWRHRISHYV
jgi:hypothetical protein